MNETVLITGITGRSGNYFLQQLEIKGGIDNDNYRVIVRPTSDTKFIDESKLSIEKVVGNLDDLFFLSQVTIGIDTILHIAGIHWSLNIVKTAIQNNVKRLILVHTTGIYSKYKEASAEYRQIENEISSLVIGRDISLTILRPTMIYGSLDDSNIIIFIKMVDKLRVFPVVDHARFGLQPVHQKDLGKAYYQVLANPISTRNKNYDLSGAYPIDLIDILKTISESLQKKTRFISIPFPIAYFGACIIYYLSLSKKDYREKVQRLVEIRVFEHKEATIDFEYNPIDFREGLKNEVELYIKGKR